MSDFTTPGAHGLGSIGFNATNSDYRRAAEHLVNLHNEGRHIDTSEMSIQDILYVHNAKNLDELRTQLRGY